MQFTLRRTIAVVVFLALALVVGDSRGQEKSSLKAWLAAAQERHQRAVEQYTQARASDARAVAQARYHEERRRDLGDLLEQAQKLPGDPAAVPALQFVITADHQGSIGVRNRAIELLARDHVRHPGIGSYCSFLAGFYYAPAAESFMRAILAKHPSREDRGKACYALASASCWRTAAR